MNEKYKKRQKKKIKKKNKLSYQFFHHKQKL